MSANMLTLQRVSYRRICRMCTRSYSDGKLASQSSSAAASVDPLKEYTPFGNLKKHKMDVWHYSNRKAGTGYSNYSSSVYQHRPYIWPPLRKLYKFNYALSFLLLLALAFDYEWLGKFLQDAVKDFVPKAAQATDDHRRIVSERKAYNASEEFERGREKTTNSDDALQKEEM